MKRFIVKSILFILSISYAEAQQKLIEQTMNCLYNFDFECANSKVSEAATISYNPHIYGFLKANTLRWEHIPIHEAKDEVLENYSKHLENTGRISFNSSLDSLMYISNALLAAEYHYNNKSYFKAFSSGSSVYKFIEHKIELPNEQVGQDWLLPVSLYNYYYSYYSETNRVLAGLIWFFTDGNKQKGLNGLKQLANTDNFAQTEALIYLSQIYLRIEDKPDSAFKYAQKLFNKHPNNLKFFEFYIEASLAVGHYDKQLSRLVIKLLNADNNYFEKYGLCYEQLLNEFATEGALLATINKINDLGGGSHLKSLLYKKVYDITKNENYKELVVEHRAYEYELTSLD